MAESEGLRRIQFLIALRCSYASITPVRDVNEIAIAQLKRDGKIKSSTQFLLLRAGKQQQRIEITRTPCNYGGDRPWFVCPKCGNRAGKLYTRDWLLHYCCRKCMDLVYPSNRYTPCDAAIAYINRIKGKLKTNRHGQLIRPKGMHL